MVTLNCDEISGEVIDDLTLNVRNEYEVESVVLYYSTFKIEICAHGEGDSRSHFANLPGTELIIGKMIRNIEFDRIGEFTIIGAWRGEDERVINYKVVIIFEDGDCVKFNMYNSSDGSNEGRVELQK